MQLLAYSDLHGRLPHVTPCETLLIAGDICPIIGEHSPDWQATWLKEVFARWCDQLPAQSIVLVPGNHDFVFEEFGGGHDYGLPAKVTLLIDAGVELPGGPQVFAQPWVPALEKWAFYASSETLAAKAAGIPAGQDIWLQHGPPLPRDVSSYRLDYVSPRHVGNEQIVPTLLDQKPPLLICGHIHEGFGRARIGETDVFNVSFLDEFYDLRWRWLELEWDDSTREFTRAELIEADRPGELFWDCVPAD
ncbi:MAG: metallophosphoesterase [Solirubrobacterales bacterium]